ncbi:MAG: NagC family transcriptional regulator [Candidatus Aenigmatarchaeota archaeon]|nr:MAG: NagC family transcriptional regulator [Candidatus Aenigmarchaeota archaeon]
MDMRALAKHLKTKQLSPQRVVFDFDNESWVFESPVVVEANMMGNVVFQVMGKHQVLRNDSEDVKLIVEKTGCSEGEAREALEKYGDVAEAILHISSNNKK